MKINKNLFKSDKSKFDMEAATRFGIAGAIVGGTTGYYLGNKVKDAALEKIANEMGIPIVDDYLKMANSVHEAGEMSEKDREIKEMLNKGPVWFKKNHQVGVLNKNECSSDPCFPPTNLYRDEEFFGMNGNYNMKYYKDLIKKYTIKGALTGTVIGSVVGGFLGALFGSDEGKKG
jgi:uncharacterized protein YdbL (DUF1318 family)